MAIDIQVAGKCEIFVAPMTSGTPAWEYLGLSIEGVTIEETFKEIPIYGDENGGPEGEPIDIQRLGQIDNIEMVLTKWDETVAAKLRCGFQGGTPGTNGTIRALLVSGLGGWMLALMPPNAAFQRAYVCAIFGEPKKMNIGTKYSQLTIPAKCGTKEGGDDQPIWTTNHLPTIV